MVRKGANIDRQEEESQGAAVQDGGAWDHSSHEEFFNYYAEKGSEDATFRHFRLIRDTLLKLPGLAGRPGSLDVADIGCGPGTGTMAWGELGHNARGLDVSEAIIQHARQRSAAADLDVSFEVGSATDIPWPAECIDVCIVPEVLEHVWDWNSVIRECTRILRPNGVIYLSTTNSLCPIQNEFNLPLYSWYPKFLKDHYVKLAQTSRPELANYAKYPAFHWFTFYSLRKTLYENGFTSAMDRFDLAALRDMGPVKNGVLAAICAVPPLRLLAHIATSGTTIAAIKKA